MEWIPCRVSRFLLAVRPVGRTDFLEIPRPFNGIPWASPTWTARHVRPVPFSGFAALRPTSSQRFPGRPKVCGRVSDRTVPGIPPFRVFPSQKIAYASRRSLASLWLSSGVLRRTTRVLVADGFPDAHAFTQLPGSPADYGLPFHAPRHASRSPWVSRRGTASFHQHHPLRSFDPSCESVRDWVGSPLSNRPIPSWVSAPLELCPSTPRILDPPGLAPEHSPSPEDSGSRLRRPQPPVPGETVPVRVAPKRPRRRIPAPFEAGPHRLSTVSPSPLTLGLERTRAHGLRSF
jgi:hypothetical protein